MCVNFRATIIQQHSDVINQSINQSIKTHFYSAICRERDTC